MTDHKKKSKRSCHEITPDTKETVLAPLPLSPAPILLTLEQRKTQVLKQAIECREMLAKQLNVLISEMRNAIFSEQYKRQMEQYIQSLSVAQLFLVKLDEMKNNLNYREIVDAERIISFAMGVISNMEVQKLYSINGISPSPLPGPGVIGEDEMKQ